MDALSCNIGPRGVRKRLFLALPLLVAGGVTSFLSRSFLGQVVAFFGFLSLFQALDRTCVFHAARGDRNLDGGKEPLEPAAIEHFRDRARRIYMRTFLATLALLVAGRAWIHWYG